MNNEANKSMRYGLSESNRGNFADRASFPAQSSVLDEEALFNRVVLLYDLPTALSCVFLERGDSDVYQIQTFGPKFYLKVYRPPDQIEKAEAEGRLVTELLRHGASVVAAVPRRDGAFATEISASEGPRPALVFEEAPSGRFDPNDEYTCRRLGAAVAQLHVAGDAVGLESIKPIAQSDLLCYVERFSYDEDFAELQYLQGHLTEKLRELPDDCDDHDIGWCHNDLTIGNIRCGVDGSVVFLDFGAANFIPWENELVRLSTALRRHGASDRYERLWAAFLDGYGRVRPLPRITENPNRSVLIGALRRIGWVGGVMASCPLRMGTETFNAEWVRNRLTRIRKSVSTSLSEGP